MLLSKRARDLFCFLGSQIITSLFRLNKQSLCYQKRGVPFEKDGTVHVNADPLNNVGFFIQVPH